MTPGGTVVRRAPGKLFVAGEWAVMDPGNPALLVAVDRYATVTASPARPGRGGADVVISSDLGVREAPWRWDGGRLTVCGGEGGRSPRLLAHVVSAVETVGRLLAERGLPLPALDVTVSSRLHEGGRKLGLGSSGAVTVATVAAVASCCGLDLPAGHRYRLALLATALLDAEASGGDVAASTFGGWIAYRAPDRAFVLDLAARAGLQKMLDAPWPGHEVRRLPPPDNLSLHIGWTGRPVSTAALLSALRHRPWRGSPVHRRFTEASNHLVRAAVAALEAGDGPGLQHQIRAARRELARLDETARLGIFTPKLTRLCEAAEAAGGAGKPSGAGGGDCGIALLDARAAHAASLMRGRWTAAGVLPLPVCAAAEATGP